MKEQLSSILKIIIITLIHLYTNYLLIYIFNNMNIHRHYDFGPDLIFMGIQFLNYIIYFCFAMTTAIKIINKIITPNSIITSLFYFFSFICAIFCLGLILVIDYGMFFNNNSSQQPLYFEYSFYLIPIAIALWLVRIVINNK